ncbi:radical SAM domain-containing protein [Candidatus Magnetomorum sp. HK-1]|nr:radical SAM domain-containing protein [Candidatus Magnetomorum sp. HK-1]
MKIFPQKILFLNPPSVKPVFRDCYCSGYSKGTFCVHPLDLQIQSGFFSTEKFQVEFIDSVFENLDIEKTIKKIQSFHPDIIIALIGELFMEKDSAFFNHLKNIFPSVRLFFSGDIARFHPKKIFQDIPKTEGVLLDFASPGILEHLYGKKSPYLLTYKSHHVFHTPRMKSYQYPLPRKEFIRKYSYSLPFFHDPHYYSIGTSFGCPNTCHYCNTHLLGYTLRPIKDIIEELHLAARLGFKSLYIRAATFMADQSRTFQLFDKWKQSKLKFEWICFTRPDLLNEELVARAAATGCCLMMLGVESFDEKWLNHMSRPMPLNTIFNAFRLLKKYKIRSAAQIMVGMSYKYQNIDIYEKKLSVFLKDLDPDYVSFNIFSNRPGIEYNDPSFNQIELNEDLYKNLAIRLERHFYFHPHNIMKQMYHLKSPKKLLILINTILNLIKSKGIY